MRSLLKIVEGAKDGEKPTHDECYYAMLVLSSLHAMDYAAVQEIGTSGSKTKRRLTLEQSAERLTTAQNQSPQEYLGNNMPGNRTYDMMRRAGKAVFGKILAKVQNDESS